MAQAWGCRTPNRRPSRKDAPVARALDELEQPFVEVLLRHGAPALEVLLPRAWHFLGLARRDEAAEHRAVRMVAGQRRDLRQHAAEPGHEPGAACLAEHA